MDHSQQAAAMFDKYASQYQEKYMDVSLYSNSLDLFCQAIPNKPADILELACGPGNVTKYVLTKRPDFHILGTDLAPKMVELARLNNPEAEFQVMDCRDVAKLEQQYHGIIASFCFPYLSKSEVLTFIYDTAYRLHSNGVLYISTMENDYSQSGLEATSSGEDAIFMHYHQADYLIAGLEEHGFEILDVSRKEYEGNKGESVVDLLIIAQLSGTR